MPYVAFKSFVASFRCIVCTTIISLVVGNVTSNVDKDFRLLPGESLQEVFDFVENTKHAFGGIPAGELQHLHVRHSLHQRALKRPLHHCICAPHETLEAYMYKSRVHLYKQFSGIC